MNYYLKNKIQKLINETLEDKANEVMEKLKFIKVYQFKSWAPILLV